MIRAFFALPISETLGLQLSLHTVSLKQQLAHEPLRWIPPENYHITLAFLGNIESRDVPRLETITADIASVHTRSELKVDGLTWFPSIHKPRLLVALISQQAALKKLQADLQQQLRLHGFYVEKRRFIPHISLARAKRNQRVKGFQLTLGELKTEMDELVLYQSELRPTGAHYSALCGSLL